MAFNESTDLNYRHLPKMRANAALRTIEEQLGRFQKVINLTRSDIKAQDWDSTVKDGLQRAPAHDGWASIRQPLNTGTLPLC